MDRPWEAPASSPGQERAGGHLLTRDHEVIRRWADQRGAQPATVRGGEADDRPGDLRFDFEGGEDRDLRTISWDDWFEQFDARDLVFIYLEPSSGEGGNFFRLESAGR